ncbi:MAG: hypothetical protein E7673_06000 [Ruminococcaceae bacterium]|nr:hypothetical protein [Oscillospiraceae bacterium]
MKKILSIILLMSCLLCICSCDTVDKVKDKITGKDDETEGFANFESAIAAASASAVVVEVKTVTKLGELNSKYEVYFSEDTSATIKYYYERFYEIGEGPADEIIEKVEGTVYRDKDGNYSEDVGIDVSAIAAATALNIAPLKSTASINEAGDVLKVTVPKISTANILGSQFASDVELEMVLRNGKLSTMKLTSATRVISYTYAA